jgi:hypothetical protein
MRRRRSVRDEFEERPKTCRDRRRTHRERRGNDRPLFRSATGKIAATATTVGDILVVVVVAAVVITVVVGAKNALVARVAVGRARRGVRVSRPRRLGAIRASVS